MVSAAFRMDDERAHEVGRLAGGEAAFLVNAAARGAVPRLEVWVESLDPVRYTASAAKQAGVLAAAPRALHIELPRAVRTTYR